MKQDDQLKLCPNCDGYVAVEVIICPYCGNSIPREEENENDEGSIEKDRNSSSLSPEETLSSLYPPPYRPKAYDASIVEEEKLYEKEEKEIVEESASFTQEISEKRSTLIPTILFSIGINIFLLSLLLFFFSEDGDLFLKWDARFWFLYLLVAAPLVFFGYKGLSKLD